MIARNPGFHYLQSFAMSMKETTPRQSPQPLPAGDPIHRVQTPASANGAQAGAVAEHFKTPSGPWNAVWPREGTSSRPDGEEKPKPSWLQRLPDKFIRGDECFRQRFGDTIALVEEDGTRCARHTRREELCPPRYRLAAETLAASMETRNGAVEDLLKARAVLGTAEAALQGAKDKLQLAQAAARRNGLPLEEALYNAEIQDAIARRDAAIKACEYEEGALNEIQANLVTRHAAAERLLNTPEAELPPFLDPEVDPERVPQPDVDRKVRLVLAAISLGFTSIAGVAAYRLHQQVVADARADWDDAIRDGRAQEDLRMAYEALNAVPAGTYAAASAAIIWGAFCAFLMAGGRI